MKKYFLLLLILCLAITSNAQKARQEMASDMTLMEAGYRAYPGPTTKLTPAPKGEKPFYISHYGRHGSRYLISKDGDYDYLLKIFNDADSLGKLTEKGKDVKRKITLLCADAYKRYGELTELGAQQHRGIARRMYRNFPEVFAGNTKIDAHSTVVIRCILSMENELQELLSLNPRLQITHDASEHDMYYMNHHDKYLISQRSTEENKTAYDNFNKRHCKPQRIIASLFRDTTYANNNIANKCNFIYHLYSLACDVPNTKLNGQVSLMDIFNADELYDAWQNENAWWYMNLGPYTGNGGMQPFTQSSLLFNIIFTADKEIVKQHPTISLRFGHDSMVYPLAALMELDNWNTAVSDPEQLDDVNYNVAKLVPMAANIQMIFYRKNFADKDVLVKVLLNENEVRLPVKTNCAPYYHWSDLREYYLNKLSTYKFFKEDF